MKSADSLSQESILFRIAKVAIAFALVVGIFLRFYNLDGKIYWRDEVFTSLQVSGQLLDVVRSDELFTGELVDKTDIAQYQYADNSTSYLDTVNGIKEFEPQLTPLYFVLVRGWNNLFGNSPFIFRLFSVLASLLCLPAMYFLCLELFEKRAVGYVATVFLAVSPFHILYAQEARPYSLWVLTTLLSCLFLLKSQKQPTFQNCFFYCISTIVSLYTFLFSITTLFAHGLYTFLSERDKLSRTVLMFLLSALLGLLAFSPWIMILINDPPSNYAAVPHDSFLAYPKGWLRNLGLPFADFGINDESAKLAVILFLVYLLLLAAVVFYAYIYLRKYAAKKTFLFLICLFLVPFLMLLIYDFGKGGQTTTRGSYLIPSILSIQIAFSYLMASKWKQNKQAWTIAFLGFLTVSTVSSIVLTHANTWWHKADENIHHEVAAIINQSDRPLVISDVEFSLPLSLSHSLEAETKYILLPLPEQTDRWALPNIPFEDFSDIFLYRPSEQLQSQLSTLPDVKLATLIEQTDNFCDCTPQVLVRVSESSK